MKERVLETINEYGMIPSGASVLVGVSGGADSMCLLAVLEELKDELGITLAAAHVNHSIRGAEADSDEKFVRSYCEKERIPFFSVRIDIPGLSAERGESTELRARTERYKYFASLGFDRIATAHTGSDAAETLLMNLSRGAALKGLCSVPPVRDNVIRPLIGLTRSDTENYCREHGIAFVTDSTNLSDEYTRNRYRHKVIPELVSINPAFEKNALRCIASLRRDEAVLEGMAEKAYSDCLDGNSLDVKKLSELDEGILYRVIALYLSRNTAADFENRHIEFAANRLYEPFAVVLPGAVRFEGNGKKLFLTENETAAGLPAEIVLDKNSPGTYYFGDFSVEIKLSCDNITDKSVMCVDFSKIDDIIKIRSRTAGDKLTLPGRRCTKSLKKLFNELKIAPEKRGLIPVLADSRGVIAVGGISADAARLPDKNSVRFLIIKTECGKNE